MKVLKWNENFALMICFALAALIVFVSFREALK